MNTVFSQQPGMSNAFGGSVSSGSVGGGSVGGGGSGKAVLTINSYNYGAWSLRGWLMARFAGLDFETRVLAPDDAQSRAEMLLLSPSILVPRLEHDGATMWDTLAIGEYLNECFPSAALLPADRVARAHCRAICGEMHSGFASLRAALPMNLKARLPHLRIWAKAQADIDRIVLIWTDCLARYGGPFLFGSRTLADAMFAPVVTRFQTYAVSVPAACTAYGAQVMALPDLQHWLDAAQQEPTAIEALEVEF